MDREREIESGQREKDITIKAILIRTERPGLIILSVWKIPACLSSFFCVFFRQPVDVQRRVGHPLPLFSYKRQLKNTT